MNIDLLPEHISSSILAERTLPVRRVTSEKVRARTVARLKQSRKPLPKTPPPARGLLMDDAGVRRVLHGIVNRMVSDGAAHEDLMQEALIHLFLLEQRRPQQTQSWYLQSCRFSLQNLCASGRSVDSMKRRHGRLDWPEDDGPSDWVHSRAEHKDEVLSQVSANDIVSLLSKRLSPREQLILTYLAEGLGVREIAVILKVSHPAVIKHRRKIAALALKLGIQPLPNGRRKKVDDSRQLDLPELELRPECRTCKYRAMALRGQCA